jgi:hypothetical protein
MIGPSQLAQAAIMERTLRELGLAAAADLLAEFNREIQSIASSPEQATWLRRRIYGNDAAPAVTP